MMSYTTSWDTIRHRSRVDAPTGHPWPISTCEASMPRTPLRDGSTQPTEGTPCSA